MSKKSEETIDTLVKLLDIVVEKWNALINASSGDKAALASAEAQIVELTNTLSSQDNAIADKLSPLVDKIKDSFGVALEVPAPSNPS
ncbi:MAG: hypothetical protein RLZZ574_2570 [Cyanobacteriota bacterium]